jgi:DNA-binding response OmpR family regulator
MKKRILSVDDDPSIRELVHDYLAENGFEVATGASGADLRRLLAEGEAHLVLLDIKMPGCGGFEIARKLRAWSDVPLIMLTGRTDVVDRVAALELGADDYVTKPFSTRELLARIRAVLRRMENSAPVDPAPTESSPPRYLFAGWELETSLRQLKSPKGKRVTLTNGEYQLLMTFLRSPRRPLTRPQLSEGIRSDLDTVDRSIDVLILRLRRKIEADPNAPKLIRTERSVGYMLDSEVMAAPA